MDEIDKTLIGADKPLGPSAIADAIAERHPDKDMPNGAQIVRAYLIRHGAAKGWVRDGDGWKKVKKPGSAQGETRE